MTNEKQKGIIGMFNLLGWPIEAAQIDGVLNPKTFDDNDARSRIASFFKIDSIYLHKGILERYAEACSRMKNINFATIRPRNQGQINL